MKRLKGVRVTPLTANGEEALNNVFKERGSKKTTALFRGLWRVKLEEGGSVTFCFRKAGLAALGFSMMKTAGQVRRFYEKRIVLLLLEFHKMMSGCGAGENDYELEVIYK